MNFMVSDWRKKEFYEIRIEGYLAPSWSKVFDGMQLALTRRGETLITGAVGELFHIPPGRLEPPFLAPEANALSTELWGQAQRFYHTLKQHPRPRVHRLT